MRRHVQINVHLDDDVDVTYHCKQAGNGHSWRLGDHGVAIYFNGTAEQLNDLGMAFLEAARRAPLPGPEVGDDWEPIETGSCDACDATVPRDQLSHVNATTVHDEGWICDTCTGAAA